MLSQNIPTPTNRAPPQRGAAAGKGGHRGLYIFNNISKEEALLSLGNAKVKNPEEALPFLASHGLSTTAPDIDNSTLLQTLTTALLELATNSKTTQLYSDLLCAFTFSLEKTHPKTQPQPQGPQEDLNLRARVDKLERTTKEQVQQTTLLTKLVEETKEMVETSTTNLERCVENACTTIREIPAQQPPPPPPTRSHTQEQQRRASPDSTPKS
jgi:hypothetical protein